MAGSAPGGGEWRWVGVGGEGNADCSRYAALLRGSNVGGNKKTPMADLRELLAGLGYSAVSTYLQSGNAVFTCADQPAVVAAAIEDALAETFAMTVRVMIRTGDELAAVVDRSPLPSGPPNPSRFV